MVICVFSLYTAVGFTRGLSILLIFSKTHLFCFIDFSLLFSSIQLVVSARVFIMSFFPNVCVCSQFFSYLWLFVTMWNIDHQFPLSMRFSRQEYWGRLPFPPPGNLPDPGIKHKFPASFALAIGFFTTESHGKLSFQLLWVYFGFNF